MCFSNLFIVNSTAVNTDKHVSLWCADSDSLVYTSRHSRYAWIIWLISFYREHFHWFIVLSVVYKRPIFPYNSSSICFYLILFLFLNLLISICLLHKVLGFGKTIPSQISNIFNLSLLSFLLVSFLSSVSYFHVTYIHQWFYISSNILGSQIRSLSEVGLFHLIQWALSVLLF